MADMSDEMDHIFQFFQKFYKDKTFSESFE